MSPPVSARSTSVAMLLFLGLTAAAPARANVDASGRWFVEADSVRCQIELSSSGTQLVASGACFHAGAVDGAGTFDAASGHFSVSGSAEGVCDSFMVDATVAPDGTSFAGTFVCVNVIPIGGFVTGSRCRNGLLACAVDDALREARSLSELTRGNPFQRMYTNATVAEIYSVSGDPRQAINTLEQLSHMSPLTSVSAEELRRHPKWAPLRADPRFPKLLADWKPL